MAEKKAIKENQSEQENPKSTKKRERKLEKELLWIFGFAIFLVLVFLVASSMFKEMNKVEYEGLVFTKERAGNIPVYHYSYYFKDKAELINYHLFLRNDPTTLDFPVEGDKIHFDRGKEVYVTLNTTGLEECHFSVIAVADLSRFLAENRLNVKSGNPDFFKAASKGLEHVTCENKPNNEVIHVYSGEETKITTTGDCHEISVANCEILEATELFKVQSILDAKNPS